jgi:FdhE protein
MDEKQAGRLLRAVADSRLSLTQLMGATFRGERTELARLSRRVRVPQRSLAWLATLLLRPYVSAAARELAVHVGRFLSEHTFWPHPYCPVCGHEPFMAILTRPSGRRQVECSLCATRWEVRRGTCVFCGEEHREGAGFLYYDLESPYRVEVCDKCRRYIKSVDARKTAADREPVLMAEDLATLYFDVLARRKRYLPPWSMIPGGKHFKKPATGEVVTGQA